MTYTTTGAPLTLFHVAARRMGDPLAVWQIAQASGLTDFWLSPGLVTLTVPTLADDNGGVPPQ